MVKLWCAVALLVGLIHSMESSAQAPLDYYCDQPADVALLLDSSSEIQAVDFEEQKRFAKNFVSYFKLRQDRLIGPAVAIVPYSDKPFTRNVIVNFFHSTNVPRVQSRIKRLSLQKGKSNLDDAFKFTMPGSGKLFDDKGVGNQGARSWVPRIVLAVTGSWRTWNTKKIEQVKKAARNLKKEGIKLMVAYIGSGGRRIFESVVDREHLYEFTLVRGLNQNLDEIAHARRMVKTLCPVPEVMQCPVTADVAFIVDSSNSIGHGDYAGTKYFVYSIANAFNISSKGAHAGVVIYSSSAKVPIKFTDHKDIESFQKAVYKLEYMRQMTRIDLGLQKAHMELFSTYYGSARAGVPKVAFILTDGHQNPKGNVSLKEAAGNLMDDKIKTFAIGIGSQVDKRELRAMVENKDDVIEAENFQDLIDQIQNISQATCEEIIKCTYPADMAFVLDSSTSVMYEDFQKMKAFVKTMAKLFRVFQHGSHGAVIVYGDSARLAIRMDEHVNYPEFIDAVDDLGRVGGRRRSFQAMALAEDVLSNYEHGARRKVPKVLLMLTAGPESSNNDYNSLHEVTARIHDRHTLVLAVGVGPNVDAKKLESLVQSEVNVFVSQSFQELNEKLILPLTNETCENVGPGDCDAKLDVAFILDTSGSISDDEFKEAKTFVKRVAKTFPVSPEKTHVALMMYNDQAKIVKRFGEITSTEEFNTEIEALPHLRGKTRIDLALLKAGGELFTWAGGMRVRNDVSKVAIVITDGRQSPAPDGIRLDEAAAGLIVQDVKVLSIGVGDKIDQEELNMMVKTPGKHTFWSKSYKELNVQLATIARESCSLPVYTE